ncbi:hypothetical protein A5756_00745 [Mycobacterium sp. 852002-53434_SCH5985345]|uniref:hypothetical protein n=1 Tax=Mycobacterium sp. 852002-53434_SCH5985345 TaxID=1834107 RepID=UPI0007FC8DF0|nr:hypothetical protein [Mycobacterium sp. 852002-53434_SCH5985345]OBF55057.1 hypothetical protein A5756_00745 [Mycobacterium sp. 852002-53434_SCH5985345]
MTYLDAQDAGPPDGDGPGAALLSDTGPHQSPPRPAQDAATDTSERSACGAARPPVDYALSQTLGKGPVVGRMVLAFGLEPAMNAGVQFTADAQANTRRIFEFVADSDDPQLKELARKAGLRRSSPAPGPRPPAEIDERERAYALGTLRSEAAELANTHKGRNARLNEAAYNAMGFVNAGSLTEAEVREALTDAGRMASPLGDHPFPDSEINDTLKSAINSSYTDGHVRYAPDAGQVIEVEPGALNGHAKTAVIDAPDHETFWTARESLRTIQNAALARMCPPWAVLAHCAARALALATPRIVLPPIIGGPGSLNWFAAVAAVSGGGKGAASATARHLVPLGGVPVRNLGSGEGMIAAYQHKPDDEHLDGVRESVMFVADEIDTATALASRTGSTTMAVLRSAFSGETLGFSYVTKGRDIHLRSGSYRMTLVLSVQPARAGALLGDHGGGTPQRFQWFPGTDARITDDPPHWTPTSLTLPNYLELAQSREIMIPDTARHVILSERAKAMRGETDALDGHALFVREKFAYALALLDGRLTMTEEDWQLSGIAAAVSTRTREQVAQRLAEAQAEEAAQLGMVRGIFNQAADEEKTFRASQRASRVAAWIVRQVTESDGGLSEGELRRQAYSRDRSVITTVLTQLAVNKVVKHDGETGQWVIA